MSHRAFICYCNLDSQFAIGLAQHLQRSLGHVFYYDNRQLPNKPFGPEIDKQNAACNVMVVIIGSSFSKWQEDEVSTARNLHNSGEEKSFFTVLLPDEAGHTVEIPEGVRFLANFPTVLKPKTIDVEGVQSTAAKIVNLLGETWRSIDLPLNPHLFSYEKDIIRFFGSIQGALTGQTGGTFDDSVRARLLEGCPAEWPAVHRWEGRRTKNRLEGVGYWRPDEARVFTAAVSEGSAPRSNLSFLEAGPRENLYYPQRIRDGLRVAVLVSGGIAPGVNAVIDGLVQRHWIYAKEHGYSTGLAIYGLKNGFRAFDDFVNSFHLLVPSAAVKPPIPGPTLDTSHHVSAGGSLLGTARVDELIEGENREKRLRAIVHKLADREVEILYIIGGDGSMKAAHAIWSVAKEEYDERRITRPLSVVTVPKTMDNDILWVWQSFGFLSAVEKAREVVEHLSTEVSSNPRLCVVQLFGSDSGFVVSHAVLASSTGSCALALIPEVPFSMHGVAHYLKDHIRQQQGARIPQGLVVMAETAIPEDALEFLTDPEIGLGNEERDALEEFDELRREGRQIQGQTSDFLRSAGLKIVSRGLLKLLPDTDTCFQAECPVHWKKLRVFTNEPRHLVRAIPPSCTDIIIGNRLGTLAVDNAMAGYTDFMISQWLTEYVLVPLKLVALGRKRIPRDGIFWKSVLAKTGQPANLVDFRCQEGH